MNRHDNFLSMVDCATHLHKMTEGELDQKTRVKQIKRAQQRKLMYAGYEMDGFARIVSSLTVLSLPVEKQHRAYLDMFHVRVIGLWKSSSHALLPVMKLMHAQRGRGALVETFSSLAEFFQRPGLKYECATFNEQQRPLLSKELLDMVDTYDAATEFVYVVQVQLPVPAVTPPAQLAKCVGDVKDVEDIASPAQLAKCVGNVKDVEDSKDGKDSNNVPTLETNIWTRQFVVSGVRPIPPSLWKIESNFSCSSPKETTLYHVPVKGPQASSRTDSASILQCLEDKLGNGFNLPCSRAICVVKEDRLNGVRFKRCQRCKTVVYCSVDCQRQHWPDHQLVCFSSAALPNCKKEVS